MSIEEQWSTYLLIDPFVPIEEGIFYVGVTNNIKRRYIEHINCQEPNTAKNAIITEILTRGALPICRTVEINKTVHDGKVSESRWIDICIELNMPLTNYEAVGKQRGHYVVNKRVVVGTATIINDNAKQG